MIALHVGWPWVAEATAIARKHPNYYLELGGLAPEYITMENGWAPLTAYMNTILKDQLLFATDFPVLDQERVLEQVRGLEPGTETLDQILGGNAAELLEL
jgi:predicted TIM-barrel fold metal-dependent hydrolase